MRMLLAVVLVGSLLIVDPVAASDSVMRRNANESALFDGHEVAVEVVAEGLNSPRGLAISRNGSIYVAESGVGGPTLLETPDGPVCLGMTGAVSRIRGGTVSVVANFPSAAEANDPDGPGPAPGSCSGDIGVAATGPASVDVEGNGDLIVSVGFGGSPEGRDLAPAELAQDFGTLQRIKQDGTVERLADLVEFEGLRDPDGQGADSNPYGVASIHHGRRLVADAGGNDILEIDAWGGVRRYVAVFPPLNPAPFTPPSCFGDLPPEAQQSFPPAGAMIPPEAVPTSVALGPDGAYYVGVLSGFPFAPGSAVVYRVDPQTGSFTTFASGLSNIVGIAFGPDGSLFVLQLADSLLELEVCQAPVPGSLVQVKNGTNITIVDNLPLPGGLVVDAYGAVYVTTNSILPGAGQVWKVTLPATGL